MNRNLTCALAAGIIVMIPVAAEAARPAAPENLTVKADAGGLLRATVSFKAPSADESGAALISINRVEVKRDGRTIKTVDVIAPGEEYEFTDILEDNGYAYYSAIAFAAGEESVSANADRVFIGVDVPLAPKSFKVADGDDRMNFSWSKVGKTGANGERVVPDNVTYELEALNDSYEPQSNLTRTKGQTYVHYFPTSLGGQDIKRFGLRAVNGSGESEYVYVKFVSGAPYNLPFMESFATGVFHGLAWQDGDGDFILSTEDSSDGDAGCLICSPLGGTETSFNMGKVLMNHALNPRISFRIKGLAEGDVVNFRVARPDGAEAKMLTINGAVDEWTLYTVDLSKLTGVKYIIPKFQLAAGNTSSFLLDDIRIDDPYDTDLGVRVNAPAVGHGIVPVSVTLTNEGLSPASNAKVNVYTDGVLTVTHKLSGELAPGESEVFESETNIGTGDSTEIKAVVRWAYDLNPANDTAFAEILTDAEPGHGMSDVEMTVSGEDTSVKEIITLDGRTLSADMEKVLAPGIYIINGRKVVIK